MLSTVAAVLYIDGERAGEGFFSYERKGLRVRGGGI